MRIKLLHYVFGPCMKGFDIEEKRIVVQMGQRTIGLSEGLLAEPGLLAKLAELAYGDALEPNAPFEKIYCVLLPGDRRVIGRGIRGMDSAGRKAYFFHHLVLEESQFIMLKGNPFILFKKIKFFEKESDIPEDRLIPPLEIEISATEIRFPLPEEAIKPIMVNLLADLLVEKPGQPVWVVLERGQEKNFIETLLGLLPIGTRKRLGFSTDFYNSYNIQHYFNLVTVNSAQEIPYKNCKIYNFLTGEYPAPAEKGAYLKALSVLPTGELPGLTEDIGYLQLNYEKTGEFTRCREILRTYIGKGEPYTAIFYEVMPIETGVLLLGAKHPGAEPEYRSFCDFYKNFVDRIEPGWYETLYEPGPVPQQLFFALFQLLEICEDSPFKRKVFSFLYRHLQAGNAAILNRLFQQYPGMSRDLWEYFKEEPSRLFYLARQPELEYSLRSRIAFILYREMLKETNEQYIPQLPALIPLLEGSGIDTLLLQAAIVAIHQIGETKKFPAEGLKWYSLSPERYREILRLGMRMVREGKVPLEPMCDYLYVGHMGQVFIQGWLEFLREEGGDIDPIELFIYMEEQNWVHLDTRGEIFNFLKKSKLKFSRVKKYRKVLKNAGKDILQYEPLWESIEQNG